MAIRKKLLLILTLLLFTANYASNPEIIVVPEKCLVNNSIYVIFQWRAPYTVENFNVTVSSDAVVFKNSTLYYAGVAEDAKILHIFEGKAVKCGNHTINVQMSYLVNKAHVKKTYTLNISIINIPEKIIIKYIPSNITENTSKTENTTLQYTNTTTSNLTSLTLNTSENINATNKTNSKEEVNNTTNKSMNLTKAIENLTTSKISQNSSIKTTNETDDNQLITYGILGLILGIIFGFVVVYIIKL
ncbi:conserved hypothetical protein [Methanocaldococcus vulcanius M7]|uniref:Uncharacterized protein n=1 Tax=Methanocaldococcus vulcanius (strain ATCC 700851 / DSM 12094 / M7) TaxID=579137 RepID=C9RGV4_METVM|nr:hypothetical protein [Methanocaldococcus vulcanius]ACX72806.1 conserved hypothetical protein [Methanocaldococcus vulcanius M7]